MALPVHAARHARLGREPDSGARRPHDRRPAAQGRDGRRTATGSSTCSTAPTASSCSRSRSSSTTWAKEIGKDGRPIELPNQRPTRRRHADVPGSVRRHQLHVAVVRPADRAVLRDRARDLHDLHVAAAPPAGYKAGDRTMGGSMRPVPSAARRAARDRSTTGDRKWECATTRRPGPACSRRPAASSSPAQRGRLLRRRSRTGKELWRYQLGHPLYAAPTTYMIDGRQYVVMPARHDADGVRAAAMTSRLKHVEAGNTKTSRLRGFARCIPTVSNTRYGIDRAVLPTTASHRSAEKSRNAGAACLGGALPVVPT